MRPIGGEYLSDQAAVPLSVDDLATHLDPGYECLEGGQRHRAARYLLTPPPERLVQLGGVDAVQPDELIGDDDRVAVDDVGRGRSANRYAGGTSR
jgi:hypothetical protein